MFLNDGRPLNYSFGNWQCFWDVDDYSVVCCFHFTLFEQVWSNLRALVPEVIKTDAGRLSGANKTNK